MSSSSSPDIVSILENSKELDRLRKDQEDILSEINKLHKKLQTSYYFLSLIIIIIIIIMLYFLIFCCLEMFNFCNCNQLVYLLFLMTNFNFFIILSSLCLLIFNFILGNNFYRPKILVKISHTLIHT
jgi:small-conductance mechanosensitive channel